MADIRPFAGIHFARRLKAEFSNLIAPPYDVLNEKDKVALQKRHPNNIVTIDLPHVPAKEVGPEAAYAEAKLTLDAWLKAKILERDKRPAIYPYTQSYDHNGRIFHRRGFIALVKLVPFGEGHIVPHEKTHKGPIEDRMKLMRATGAQLSPIFGLYDDVRHEVTDLLYRNQGVPMLSGTIDGVRNDLWSVIDADVENQVIDLMNAKPIYIADGHHRYTTALQYQYEAMKANNGPLPAAHPANWCMFVLVGMQDPGLLILPTHRLIGNLGSFNIAALRKSLGDNAEIAQAPIQVGDGGKLQELVNHAPAHTFGLYDGIHREYYTIQIKNNDVLMLLEPKHSPAWRKLDVAIAQRYLLEEIIAPTFAGGKEISIGYTADPYEIAPQVDGKKYQIALVLKPTPLQALEELGKVGDVMPQKSTYFFPKLATGMLINPLA